MRELWTAPVAVRPVDATVRLPGSKSMTNRALVLAALATGPSVLHDPLVARDTVLMADALTALGADLDRRTTSWSARPAPLRGPAVLDVGNAGTVLRFLLAVAALADGPVAIDGDPRVRERPLAPLIEALRGLGVRIDGDRLPLVVHGVGRLPGGTVTLDASTSSQFVSALLLAGARADKALTVRHEGPPLPSVPHVRMTVAMLRAAGRVVHEDADAWTVEPGPVERPEWRIEPDLSNAAPFLAAALVTGGTVRVPGWPADTTQPGAALPVLLSRMGASVAVHGDRLTLHGGPRLQGLVADLRDVGELAPVLAAVCALAATPSRLTGLGHLRGHETDRLRALRTELCALGGAVTELADGLVVHPAPLRAGVFHTYDDHRLATAGALLGLVVPGVQVEDVATTAKTLPDFTVRWTAMLGAAEPGRRAGAEEPVEHEAAS